MDIKFITQVSVVHVETKQKHWIKFSKSKSYDEAPREYWKIDEYNIINLNTTEDALEVTIECDDRKETTEEFTEYQCHDYDLTSLKIAHDLIAKGYKVEETEYKFYLYPPARDIYLAKYGECRQYGDFELLKDVKFYIQP
ncbi:MAG TPA: hypothetical protein VD757_00420 [Candidatus Nitrosocosmicus sp.]|nr:hypothetical protein [Candidatus Nitrosocosmicus sp.]